MDTATLLLLARTLRRVGRRCLIGWDRRPLMDENTALVLGALLRKDSWSQSGLAGRAGLDPATVSRILSNLESRGWVRRTGFGLGNSKPVKLGDVPTEVWTALNRVNSSAFLRVCPTGQLSRGEVAAVIGQLDDIAYLLDPGRYN